IETVEAHRELTGLEIEILHYGRVKRIAVACRREREHATIGRRCVRSARVRLAMREPDREHRPDGEGDVFHHAMQPAATITLKQIFPCEILRSGRRGSDASW